MGLCDGRVVVVTGAGRGIGRAHALMLAKEGAKVVVNDLGAGPDGEGSESATARQVADEIVAAGGEAYADGSDVADWDQAQALIQGAVDRYGGLDVLINNAGIIRDRMMVNLSERDFDVVVNVNLKGTFATCHHAANYWRLESKGGRQRDARIINTTSGSGLFGNVGQSNYAAAKAGVAAFSIVIARELQRIGVAVNVIAPRAQSRLTEGLREVTEEVRMRRDPDWIAALVTWLASAKSSDITGRVFEAWGYGFSVAEGWSHGPMMPATRDPHAVEDGLRHIVAAARFNEHYERDTWLNP